MVNNSAYLMTGDHLDYLVRILNSSLIEVAYRTFYGTILGEKGLRWLAQNIIYLPIPAFNATSIQESISRETDSDNINQLVYILYGLEAEEVAHIEALALV